MSRVPILLSLAMACAAGGCFSHQTSAGRYVTDIDVVDGQLVVESCEVGYETSEAWFSNSRHEEVTLSECSSARAPVPAVAPVDEGGAP